MGSNINIIERILVYVNPEEVAECVLLAGINM